MDEDLPTSAMQLPVVGFAQKDTVVHPGLTPLGPGPTVMRLAPSRWPPGTGEGASPLPGDERAANGQGEGAHRPSDVEGFGLPTPEDGDDCRIASPASSGCGAEVGSLVQGRAAPTGA